MMPDNPTQPTGAFSFFAAWMLLHEKADDWLRDALRRAKETPDEMRKDYQNFLLKVDDEKEALKSIFAEAMVHELKHLGFVHQSDSETLSQEVRELRERLCALEEQLDRLKEDK